MTRLPNGFTVLLCGCRQAGKDTLFNLLRSIDHRCRRFAFADKMKEDLRQLCISQFGIDPLTATGEEKEFLRPLFISYGCMWREKDPDHWVRKVADHIQQNHLCNPQPMLHITTDGRFENEVGLFRERFGSNLRVIWVDRIGAPPPTDEERKHIDSVRAMADYSITWGNDTEGQRALTAAKLVAWLEESMKITPNGGSIHV